MIVSRYGSLQVQGIVQSEAGTSGRVQSGHEPRLSEEKRKRKGEGREQIQMQQPGGSKEQGSESFMESQTKYIWDEIKSWITNNSIYTPDQDCIFVLKKV